MDNNLLQEFIQYAKSLGYDVRVEKSDTPDSFQRIFRITFSEMYPTDSSQHIPIEDYNEVSITPEHGHGKKG